MMASPAQNFRLQFFDAESLTVLEDRPVRAADVDDAVREAAFGDRPADTQLCRIASMDGQGIASVGLVRRT
jgi:hypothetical protein